MTMTETQKPTSTLYGGTVTYDQAIVETYQSASVGDWIVL